MGVIRAVSNYIGKETPRYTIMLLTGEIIRTTFIDSQNEKILANLTDLKNLENSIPLKEILTIMPFVYYRIVPNLIVVLPINIGKKVYEPLFRHLTEEFEPFLLKKFENIPHSVGDLINFHIFSAALGAGPEPITSISIPPHEELEEAELWNYSMTSLMVLVNQTSAFKDQLLLFHPFLEDDKLGIVFLFRIPLPGVRGDSINATLLSMVNYEDRKRIYELHEILENVYIDFGDEIRKVFSDHINEIFKNKIPEMISTETSPEIRTNSPVKQVLNNLQDALIDVLLPPLTPDDVRKEMIRSAKIIKKKLEGD